MAILHVRDVPDSLYKRMQKIAKSRGRTLSAEVIALFEEVVEREEIRRKQADLLAAIYRDRWTPPPGTPDSVEMIRQIREEREAELLRRARE